MKFKEDAPPVKVSKQIILAAFEGNLTALEILLENQVK
jgi:hypothetical protein